ncbi:MAG: glutamate--cysteine ligase [Rickettsiales bacterium]|nr:glutamate--cysteine ligase [Rickettsiales bacterium]
MINLKSVIENVISQQYDEIIDWINKRYGEKPSFYSSIDIRYSGLKVAPVDTNLFPAGFNNLSNEAISQASLLANKTLNNYSHKIKNILLIPESHTRNKGYLENIATIFKILTDANFEVKVAALDDELDGFELSNKIKYSAIIKEENQIITKSGFKPDCIIINNDMTTGRPEILSGISQPILPTIGMGWYQREKIAHLKAYDNLIGEFAQTFNIPKPLISTEFGFCKNINFKEKKGLDCVANEVEKVLFKIKKNYQKYDINDKPYVFIKANRGTYGMGIMTVSSGQEIYEINKKARNKMSVIKNNTSNAEIIVQEGVKTSLNVDNKPCEAFIYQIGGSTCGTIYRINESKTAYSNLNSKGVEFLSVEKNNLGNYYYLYDVIASLSTLAATMEHDYK